MSDRRTSGHLRQKVAALWMRQTPPCRLYDISDFTDILDSSFEVTIVA